MQLPIPYFWQSAGHWQTVSRVFFAKDRLPYRRERIPTPDDDFLDLDWLTEKTEPGAPLLLFCHGLEGDSQSSYIPLTVQAFRHHHCWPVLAWNYRSCSGEMNRQPRFYNLGDTDDLDTVLAYAQGQGYGRILLIGFSAGGSIVLNYLGKSPGEARLRGVIGGAAISTPLHLEGSARRLETPGSMFYNRRFCASLIAKTKAKAARLGSAFPIQVGGLEQACTLRRFDAWVTAPLHGFPSAEVYYARSSGLPLLPGIEVPTLLWSARNDPFLSAACYPPEAQAGHWPLIRARFPDAGGHCGFALSDASALLEAVADGFWPV